MRISRLSLTCIVLFHPLALAVAAETLGDAKPPNPIQWREPNRVVLELRGGKSENVAKWTIDLGRQGDFLLTVAGAPGGGAGDGQVLVVDGQAMVVEGLDLEQGYEIDAIDMPAFHFQLLYGVLERFFPNGPASVNGEQAIEHAEDHSPILVGTASATGEFAAPWFAKGTVSRRDDTNVDFDLAFTFTVDPDTATTFTLHLSGTWTGGSKAFAIGNEFRIEGWAVFAIGPYDVKTKDGVVTEYGAQATGASYRTVGELRAALERADGENERK